MRFWLSVRVTSSSSESVELASADNSPSAAGRKCSLGVDGAPGPHDRVGDGAAAPPSAEPGLREALPPEPILGESRRPSP